MPKVTPQAVLICLVMIDLGWHLALHGRRLPPEWREWSVWRRAGLWVTVGTLLWWGGWFG